LALYSGESARPLCVPDRTMYEMLADSAVAGPRRPVLRYMGATMTYERLLDQVDRFAAALRAHGVAAGDSVVVSLPNIPNVVIAFYALNRLGARAVMTHPLSTQDELEHYIGSTGARLAITADLFYPLFARLMASTGLEQIIIAHVGDYLTAPVRLGFWVTRGRRIPAVPYGPAVFDWRELLAARIPIPEYVRPGSVRDGAVVLFSGGTTAMPKGIELSSYNFNALAVAMQLITGAQVDDSILAILPAFHGFGLGLCIHTPICIGACEILVPEFSTSIYIDNLLKHRPTIFAGVPTLFEALLRDPRFAQVDFSNVKGIYSGGDVLTPALKHRFDEVIAAHGGTTELVEGYGLTECVTACVVSPPNHYREGSVGIPIPGCDAMVADPVTGEPVPYGTEGEICMTGPTLMLGYVNDPQATANTLRRHADGTVWLHTGDLGTMDADGFLYFRGRSKRLIKVSGMSVYPMQVEQVLEAHPSVARACVIGVPDDYQVSKVKAFVTLASGTARTPGLEDELIDHCKQHLIRWSAPRIVEIRDELPMTKVGKIAYTQLEQEELAKTAR